MKDRKIVRLDIDEDFKRIKRTIPTRKRRIRTVAIYAILGMVIIVFGSILFIFSFRRNNIPDVLLSILSIGAGLFVLAVSIRLALVHFNWEKEDAHEKSHKTKDDDILLELDRNMQLLQEHMDKTWKEEGRDKKCPDCERGPFQYFSIDDEILWLIVTKDGKFEKNGPECESAPIEDIIYLPTDSDNKILAMVETNRLDKCPNCGVSRILWTEVRKDSKNEIEWADYYHPSGEIIFRVANIGFFTKEEIKKHSVKIGSNYLEIALGIPPQSDKRKNRK